MYSNTGTACVEIAFSSLFKKKCSRCWAKNGTNEDRNAHMNSF
jgi:hypothetical protein